MKPKFALLAFAAFALALFVPNAVAAAKVKLPATAKMLTMAEVVAIYGGKTAEWAHPNGDKATGTATWDAAVAFSSGTWKSGKDSGHWDSKISWKGDQYCYEARGAVGDAPMPKKYSKMVCNLVYQDTDGLIYEVDPKTKKVMSTDKLK